MAKAQAKAQPTPDRKKAQTKPVDDPAKLTDWWAMAFEPPFYCYKVHVVGRRAGPNGEDFLSFTLVGEAARQKPPKSKGPFEVDLNAGGALVWPYLPSTAQFVKNPKSAKTYGYLFVNQIWAKSVGIRNAKFYAEDGPGGGKWPIAAG